MDINFGKKIIWQRAKDYLSFYKPKIITVSGVSDLLVTQLAVAKAIESQLTTRASQRAYTNVADVACDILGVEPKKRNYSWFKILNRSLIKETKNPEPEAIALKVKPQKPGMIDWISKQLPTDIAIITNTDTAYLDIFSTQEMLVHELSSLAVMLPEEGYLLINADDSLALTIGLRTKANIITFGSSDNADIQLKRRERLKNGGMACEIEAMGKLFEINLRNIISQRQIYSILAAIATAYALKLNINEAVNSLQTFTPPQHYMNLVSGINNSKVIDGTASATPQDMILSLETLRALSANRKVAILGDIKRLASKTNETHHKIGKMVADVAELVILVGDHMRIAGSESIFIGRDTHHFEHSRDVGKWLKSSIRPGDLVLVKGGEEMKMGEIIKRIT